MPNQQLLRDMDDNEALCLSCITGIESVANFFFTKFSCVIPSFILDSLGKGHTQPISEICVFKDHLFSSQHGGTSIKQWNIHTGDYIHEYILNLPEQKQREF